LDGPYSSRQDFLHDVLFALPLEDFLKQKWAIFLAHEGYDLPQSV
jgi:hypothetical protein